MMDDSAPTYKKGKLVETYKKMCSLKNGLWLLKYAGRSATKMIKKMGVEKRGNAERDIKLNFHHIYQGSSKSAHRSQDINQKSETDRQRCYKFEVPSTPLT